MNQNSNLYADIIIDISNEKVDRVFQYRVPEDLAAKIKVGVQVEIPFGNGNSRRKGYVVGITAEPEYEISKIKEIAGVVTDSVSVQSQLIQLAWWMKEQYGSTMNQALKTVLPVKQKIKPREKKSLRWNLTKEDLLYAIETTQKKGYRARGRLLAAFMDLQVIPMEMVKNQLNLSDASWKPLVEAGQVSLDVAEVFRNPVEGLKKEPDAVRLNKEQQEIVERFRGDYIQERTGTYLIHGITGSGKTEVYMELISCVMERGKQVIVLIPEIALTYQTVMRFYKRFGDQVSIINSRLSKGERFDQWERAKDGDISIMIGPRSALFTPFQDLGMIIIDEEHEGAYKSETMPRYHARDVAVKRAAMNHASVVLGSATPSLEAYTRALKGEYRLFTLTRRAKDESRLATVHIEDLREELKQGNKTMFSRKLRELMEDRLGRNEQIMLFINRRGYANFVSCRSCGNAVKCPHCDVSLTLHNNGCLTCHYCGHSIRMPKLCPSCGSPYIAHFGVGTQKLEVMTAKMFPAARILRMDADTTSKKGGHEEILNAFSQKEADILIGTQMIVKGHDFPNVTLVGIMAADLSLNTPDFRCGERTFQLLTQAAGRAGRGQAKGDVVIQTYNPEHYSIETAGRQDYLSFYNQEMTYRELMNYPPVCRMMTIQAAGRQEEKLKEAVDEVNRLVKIMETEWEGLQVIGPVNATVYKVNDIYRKILYIKHENYDILVKIRGKIEAYIKENEIFKHVLIQYDFS